MKKDLRAMIRLAQSQGWSVSRTKGGHYRWTPPRKDAPLVITASTPSDRRALKNDLSRLRRAGLVA